ncbi:MAG: cysteine desulfurase family protein [Acidobacteriota bacterium]
MAACYFDHNATTPLDPRVRQAMLPWMGERFGNPSSIHSFGQVAREAVERAREQVARLLDASPVEIVFTASATEANNSVIRSCVASRSGRAHLVVSLMEHPSVSAVATDLERSGSEVAWVPPERDGVVAADRVLAVVESRTALVCVALANNIIGTVQPVETVSERCRELGVPVLCDAVQGIGKMPISVGDLGPDFLSLSAHKFNGPPGAGALWIRNEVEWRPFLLGGSQERRRRAGTQNVPAIVGMGEAAELALRELESRQANMAALRDRLESGLRNLGDLTIHGESATRLPNTTHVAFAGIDALSLLIRLDLAGYAVSAGSACSSGSVEPSTALLSMGIDKSEALSSLRISLGAGNETAEVDRFLMDLERELSALRQARVGSET